MKENEMNETNETIQKDNLYKVDLNQMDTSCSECPGMYTEYMVQADSFSEAEQIVDQKMKNQNPEGLDNLVYQILNIEYMRQNIVLKS